MFASITAASSKPGMITPMPSLIVSPSAVVHAAPTVEPRGGRVITAPRCSAAAVASTIIGISMMPCVKIAGIMKVGL